MALTTRETREQFVDEAAFEQNGSTVMQRRCATDYIRATNPAGTAVTFVPGEALPAWAVDALATGHVTHDGGAWTLNVPDVESNAPKKKAK